MFTPHMVMTADGTDCMIANSSRMMSYM